VHIVKKFLAAFMVISGSTAVMWFAWMSFLPKEPCFVSVPAYVETLSKAEQQKFFDGVRKACEDNGQEYKN